MYCILTGEIKLRNMPDEEGLAQLGFSLQRTAIDLDFNICMYAKLPYSGLYNYPLKSLNDGLIPYQITEHPMFDQCHRTFEGLWFRENTWQISNLENTRLPKLQEFYTDVMKNTDIEYMTVYFENEKFICYRLKQNVFSLYELGIRLGNRTKMKEKPCKEGGTDV